MNPLSLTVAILTRNRLGCLKTALAALAAQDPLPDEVLVVDTGSTDGTREWVRQMAVHDESSSALVVRLLEDSGEGAYAGARNRACEAARSELVAFLDDDCEPDTRWVARILTRFQADPELDLLGGVTLPARALSFPDWWPPEINWVAGLSVPGCWGDEAGRVHLGQTSNLAFRRRVWEAVRFGELGETNFAAGGAVYDSGREDVDWWRRLRRLGYRVEMDGRLLAWHDIPAARLKWDDALDRARRDGRSHWRRAGTPEDVRAAASDIAHAPARFVAALARRGTTAAQAYRLVRLWAARQAALLGAGVDSWEKPINPRDRTQALLAEAARLVAGVGKRAARRATSALHTRLRHTRPVPTPDAPPRRMLLVSTGFLGDQFLVQPALRLLRRTYPDTELTLLTGRFGAELYGESAPEADRRWVDRAVDADAWKGCSLPERHRRLHRLVAELDPGAIAVFYAHRLWPAPLFLTRNAPVLGFDHDCGFESRFWNDLLTVRFHKDWNRHEMVNHLQLVRALGAEGRIEPYTLAVPDADVRWVDERLGELGLRGTDGEGARDGREFVVINPGAGQRYKEWPAERWFQLARWIENETPFAVAFTGGRVEHLLVERFQAKGLRARDACLWPLRPTAALLRRARLLIGADSGPKHIAVAVAAPTLTLHGPTEEWRWEPLWDRPLHRSLRRGCPDLTGEDLRGLPVDWTMRQIEVEDVVAAFEAILGPGHAKTVCPSASG